MFEGRGLLGGRVVSGRRISISSSIICPKLDGVPRTTVNVRKLTDDHLVNEFLLNYIFIDAVAVIHDEVGVDHDPVLLHVASIAKILHVPIHYLDDLGCSLSNRSHRFPGLWVSRCRCASFDASRLARARGWRGAFGASFGFRHGVVIVSFYVHLLDGVLTDT